MNPHDDDTQFWAEPARRTGQMPRIRRHAETTGQLRRTEPSGGPYERTREHRIIPPRPVSDTHATPITLQAFDYDLDEDYADLRRPDHGDAAAWAVVDDVDVWVQPEQRPARPVGAGVDPKLMRFGALAAAAVVLVPVAMATAGGGGGDGGAEEIASETLPAAVAEVLPAGEPTTTVAVVPITAAARNSVTTAGDNPADDDQQVATASVGGVAEKPAVGSTGNTATPTAQPAPSCAGQYTVVSGDYWLRFDGTGASIDEWLTANEATLETPLFPGVELCIPAGAAAPSAPTTTAPPTTAAPATAAPTTAAPTTAAPVTAAPATAAPTTATPTTAAPTTAAPTTAAPTTAAPTTGAPTTAAPTTAPPVTGSPEQIIRAIFPDDEEDYAITIARRESSLNPRAYNGWCCYGLFQMYYEVHKSWMVDLGINSREDLYDPYKNTLAAYTLWQRTGWGAWSTHR